MSEGMASCLQTDLVELNRGCPGGIVGESYASCGRVSNVIPVDAAVPGCPPTPTAIKQGILTAISAGSGRRAR